MEIKHEKQNVLADGIVGRNGVKVSKLLAKLRILTEEKFPTLKQPPESDNTLERCLRHRKFNMKEAAYQVHSFFKLIYDLNKMKKENLFVPSIHRINFLDSFSMGVLKERDPKGTSICFITYESMPGETFCPAKCMAVGVMLLNELFYRSEDKKDREVVLLVNMKGFQFAHAKQFGLSKLRALAEILQGAVPVSFKAIHCINMSSLFYYTYALLKPFLRQKIKERIHLHADDIADFYKVVDKSLLPIAMEGDLPNEKGVDTNLVEALCKKDEHYRVFLQYGYAG